MGIWEDSLHFMSNHRDSQGFIRLSISLRFIGNCGDLHGIIGFYIDLQGFMRNCRDLWGIVSIHEIWSNSLWFMNNQEDLWNFVKFTWLCEESQWFMTFFVKFTWIHEESWEFHSSNPALNLHQPIVSTLTFPPTPIQIISDNNLNTHIQLNWTVNSYLPNTHHPTLHPILHPTSIQPVHPYCAVLSWT